MESTDEPSKSNDYALANKLDTTATYLVHGLCDMLRNLEFLDYDEEYYRIIKNANRAYILLVHELDAIYSRNESLAKLNEDSNTRAVWKRFDVIEGNELAIHEFSKGFKNHINTQSHSAQVERLAIIAGQEETTLTPELEELIKEADIAGVMAASYGQKKRPKSKTSGRGTRYIPSYKLEYKDDGRIVVNGVLTLKKTQNGSAPRKLMEQALKHPYEPFKPELGKLSRSFSSVLNDMGITGTFKKLFFPTANKDEVLFRPIIDRSRAEDEQLKLDELDKQLKDLGAFTRSIMDNEISDEPMSKEEEELFNSEAVQLALKKMDEANANDTQ